MNRIRASLSGYTMQLQTMIEYTVISSYFVLVIYLDLDVTTSNMVNLSRTTCGKAFTTIF